MILHLLAATSPSWASIVTAITAVIGLFTGLGTLAILGLRLRAELRGIKHAVNSTAAAQNERVDTLTSALTDAGVEVPARPSDTPIGEP